MDFFGFAFAFAFVVVSMNTRRGSVLQSSAHALTLVLKEWGVLPREPLWPSLVNQPLETAQNSASPVTHSGNKKETAETM